MLNASFAVTLVNDEPCAVAEDLDHLPVSVVYRLALWYGAVDLTA